MTLFRHTSSYKKNIAPACDGCKSPQYVRYKWTTEIQSHFSFTGTAKNGSLYECQSCKENWYLDNNEEYLYLLGDAVEATDWATKKLLLPSHILEKIFSIGGDLLHGITKKISFPCRIETIDGQIIDPARIVFQEFPPPLTKDVFFIDSIKDVSPSKFSLSPTIRYASSRQEETSMGRAQTNIHIPEGPGMIINYYRDFVVDEIHPGSFFKLGYHPDTLLEPDEKSLNIPTFLADWNDSIAYSFLGSPLLFIKRELGHYPFLGPDPNSPEIVRQEISRLRGNIFCTHNIADLLPALKRLQLAPQFLVFNGYSFSENEHEWSSFDKRKSVGLVTLKASCNLKEIDTLMTVFFNQLLQKGGMHILLELPEPCIEWMKDKGCFIGI